MSHAINPYDVILPAISQSMAAASTSAAAVAAKGNKPRPPNLYELLCAERPTHWFAPPTIVTRASGMEVVLYPDVVVDMVRADMQKVVAYVSRADLADEDVRAFVCYLHGATASCDAPVLPTDVFAMLRHIKRQLDMADQLVECGVVPDKYFEENLQLQLARELSTNPTVQDFWAGRAEGVTLASVTAAIGFTNSMKMIGALITSGCPIASRITDYTGNHKRTCIQVTDAVLSGPMPDGYVLFDLGETKEEEVDKDELVFPSLLGPGTKFLVHGPSIWIRWQYIRRMHAMKAREVETRHIVMPGDFPRKLFALLMCILLRTFTARQGVLMMTPRQVSYLQEHAGEYDLVDGNGVPHRDFTDLFSCLRFYNWEDNKRAILAAVEKVTADQKAQALAASMVASSSNEVDASASSSSSSVSRTHCHSSSSDRPI